MSLLILFKGSGGPALRCLVLLDGSICELPAGGPQGAALRLSSGGLVAGGAGTPLVYDHTTFQIRQAAVGESVLTP